MQVPASGPAPNVLLRLRRLGGGLRSSLRGHLHRGLRGRLRSRLGSSLGSRLRSGLRGSGGLRSSLGSSSGLRSGLGGSGGLRGRLRSSLGSSGLGSSSLRGSGLGRRLRSSGLGGSSRLGSSLGSGGLRGSGLRRSLRSRRLRSSLCLRCSSGLRCRLGLFYATRGLRSLRHGDILRIGRHTMSVETKAEKRVFATSFSTLLPHRLCESGLVEGLVLSSATLRKRQPARPDAHDRSREFLFIFRVF